MLGFILIAILGYIVLRSILIFISCFVEAWYEVRNEPLVLDVEALQRDLQTKNEAELWELRNEYHGYLVESINTPDYRFFLDIIGEIDKQIYALREINRKIHALRE